MAVCFESSTRQLPKQAQICNATVVGGDEVTAKRGGVHRELQGSEHEDTGACKSHDPTSVRRAAAPQARARARTASRSSKMTHPEMRVERRLPDRAPPSLSPWHILGLG